MNIVWAKIWGLLAKLLTGGDNIATMWEVGTGLGAYIVESSSDDIKSSWSAKHAIRVLEDETSILAAKATADAARAKLIARMA
jgi:hypothetical protein